MASAEKQVPPPDIAEPEPADGAEAEADAFRLTRNLGDRGPSLSERLSDRLDRLSFASPFHRMRLKGRFPLKLIAVPEDPVPGDPAIAQRLKGGRLFRGGYGQGMLEARLDHPEAPESWRQWVHGWGWLRDLSMVELSAPEAARAEALNSGQPAHDEPHEMFDSAFYNGFRRLVNWCVAHRWLTIAATVALFALGVLGMGKVQQQFFPDSSRPEILVDLWSPEGTSFTANEAVAKRVEARLMAEPGVTSVTQWIGAGVPRFYLPLDQIFPQTNVSQLIVLPRDLATRDQLRLKLPTILAAEFPVVRGLVKLLPNGPPVAYPVQFRVIGPDPARLRAHADEVVAAMRESPNTRGVNDNRHE